MTDKEEIESLYRRGLLPVWAYYQLNGKTAAENYRQQKQERIRAEKELADYRARRKAEIDADIEKQIEEEIYPKIEKAFGELLSDWF